MTHKTLNKQQLEYLIDSFQDNVNSLERIKVNIKKLGQSERTEAKVKYYLSAAIDTWRKVNENHADLLEKIAALTEGATRKLPEEFTRAKTAFRKILQFVRDCNLDIVPEEFRDIDNLQLNLNSTEEVNDRAQLSALQTEAFFTTKLANSAIHLSNANGKIHNEPIKRRT